MNLVSTPKSDLVHCIQLYTPTLLAMSPIILASNEKIHSPFRTCVGKTKNIKAINYILFHVFVAICIISYGWQWTFLWQISFLFLKIKHMTFWNSRVNQCDFLFFQSSNIENLAKISTKKKAKLVKFTIKKKKIPILFVEKSRKFVGKTTMVPELIINPSRFFLWILWDRWSNDHT